MRLVMLTLALAGFVAGAGCLGLAILTAGEHPQPSPSDLNDVSVRYADACWRLADAELRLVMEINQKSPRAISEVRIKWYKANLEIAKRQAAAARQVGHATTLPVQLAFAEATAQYARHEYEAAFGIRGDDRPCIGCAGASRALLVPRFSARQVAPLNEE